jgi:hypothetical protein
MFKIGQKVVCVSSFEELRKIWGFSYPKVGEIVEVLSIRKHHAVDDYLISITGLECEVCASRFKPLQYDVFSNEEIIREIITERLEKPIKTI